MRQPLIVFTKKGLYCPAGDFYIDPWRPVEHAVVTHGHADHAYYGMKRYYATPVTAAVMRVRLGADNLIHEHSYYEPFSIGGVSLSFHPAGHVPGSAQVRVEYQGRVWVATGDYKLEDDGLAEPFEIVEAEGMITEATFGLPIYTWKPQQQVFDDILTWWKANRDAGKASLLYGYSFGKTQRLLYHLAPHGNIYGHGAAVNITEALRGTGVPLPPLETPPLLKNKDEIIPGSLILAPPSAGGTTWVKRFGDYEEAFVSGWMALRSSRRSRNIQHGFAMSDHADWPDLLKAIQRSKAQFVQPFCGSKDQLSRYLREELHLDAPDAPASPSRLGSSEETD